MKEKIIKLFKFLRPVIVAILFTWIPCFVVIYKDKPIIGTIFFIIWLFEADDLLKVMKEYYNNKDKK